MSKYTTTLRNIVETMNGWDPTKNINEKIEVARSLIFDFDYPIDEKYKKNLETKIIRHFYVREIAHETVDMWLFRLETKMQEMMPYYNDLYKTAVYDINPLYNYSMTETTERKNKANATNIDNSKGNQRNVMYDTPDNNLEILDGRMASGVQDQDNSSNNKNESVSENVEDYIRNITGNTGTPIGTLLNDYRSSIINIDMMIIDELNDLFYVLY